MTKFQQFFLIYFYIINLIGHIHFAYLNHMKFGTVTWILLVGALYNLFAFLFFMLQVDFTVRNSKIPQNLNLKTLCSDIDCHWGMSVRLFLKNCYYRIINLFFFFFKVYDFFIELKLEGIHFYLSNSFCLTVCSLIITYFTILFELELIRKYKKPFIG